MKRKLTKKMKENGMTVRLPFTTKYHSIDYNEKSDEFEVTCFDTNSPNKGEIVGRYSTFLDAWSDAKFFEEDGKNEDTDTQQVLEQWAKGQWKDSL